MTNIKKNIWIDTRLNEETMKFLNVAISEENKKNCKQTLAGNIFKSELIIDKDNWFYETTLKKLTERMFYRDLDEYHKYYIEKEDPLPEFELSDFWVNFQKQYEFNPLHNHHGLYSFVVFMKIPTHWKEQHALPISVNSNAPVASDFEFVQSKKDNGECFTSQFPLSSEDEGRMLFFPASLYHQVYPFYGTEKERITISGNIVLDVPKKQEVVKLSGDEYEEKEKIIKMMENSVEIMKEELEQMKERK
jgi:hypothetical protein|tara:strand:- start:54 stop:797 length:744 start_codon:yes stop_codon:yes gene_type:complete